MLLFWVRRIFSKLARKRANVMVGGVGDGGEANFASWTCRRGDDVDVDEPASAVTVVLL